ncbi:hypothetical protein ARALYDRAFT_905270 [Arabidopsis lyrata subsp. lyrata]|uniref:Uncharacterized protein n=1 Tax=Arabidopsis lyrata subsp. lyrata TaxID=81972 RepID=D7LP10_ARALL|nr:uncharacterized protein LOC9311591 [Arabidopsis lyrata subsp. lyrata]EFH53456.1 hypothetical protein ARALYDRAFT_905270 [Arabidopsis lyrata subsp. lyrata]|eukprot:XP_002877197.1 uncharacterized protein LOC9311591 [Arabidopsis lyrata subsp. lyrata]
MKITCSLSKPPRDNLMLISSERSFVSYLDMLAMKRVPVIRELQSDEVSPIVWERFLSAGGVDSGDLDEDPGWSCEVCFSTGHGFENFLVHLKHTPRNEATKDEEEDEDDDTPRNEASEKQSEASSEASKKQSEASLAF